MSTSDVRVISCKPHLLHVLARRRTRFDEIAQSAPAGEHVRSAALIERDRVTNRLDRRVVTQMRKAFRSEDAERLHGVPHAEKTDLNRTRSREELAKFLIDGTDLTALTLVTDVREVFSVEFERVWNQVPCVGSKHADAVQEPANEADRQGATAEAQEIDLIARHIPIHDEA